MNAQAGALEKKVQKHGYTGGGAERQGEPDGIFSGCLFYRHIRAVGMASLQDI
jgi:hypothetical protein